MLKNCFKKLTRHLAIDGDCYQLLILCNSDNTNNLIFTVIYKPYECILSKRIIKFKFGFLWVFKARDNKTRRLNGLLGM